MYPTTPRSTVTPQPTQSLEQDRNSSPRAYEKWQPEEDEQLATLHAERQPLAMIAAELGHQPSAIDSRLNSGPHLARVRKSPSRDQYETQSRATETDLNATPTPSCLCESGCRRKTEQLSRHVQGGTFTIPDIASELGRQPSAVVSSRLRHISGITTGYRLALSETEEQTLALVRQGLSVSQRSPGNRDLSSGTVLTHLGTDHRRRK